MEFICKKNIKILPHLKDYLLHLESASHDMLYNSPESVLSLVIDKSLLLQSQNASRDKKTSQLSEVMVVGIGGSSLGSYSVYKALQPKGAPVSFFDTADPEVLNDACSRIRSSRNNGKSIVINFISKSGATVETMINARVLIGELRKINSKWQSSVVVTSEPGSKLYDWAKVNKTTILDNPRNVVGRFSVFSPVGIFPLMLSGVNVKKLLSGAQKMVKKCVLFSKDNSALISALSIFDAINSGSVAHNLFFFNKRLEGAGKWCQQLSGESLGKDGKGILPIASIGTEDLHSMYQFFLGGPRNIYTTFVRSGSSSDTNIPAIDSKLDEITPNISCKSVSYVINTIYEAVKKSYEKNNIHFSEVLLGSINEDEIGQFLQFKMIETMILAKLLEVDAFSQDNVEEYKKITRELLS